MKDLLEMRTGHLRTRKLLTDFLMLYGNSWDEDFSLYAKSVWYLHSMLMPKDEEQEECTVTQMVLFLGGKHISINKGKMPFRHHIQGNTFNAVVSWSSNWKNMNLEDMYEDCWLIWLLQQIMICQTQNIQFSATSIACYTGCILPFLPQSLLAFLFPEHLWPFAFPNSLHRLSHCLTIIQPLYSPQEGEESITDSL